MQVTSHFHGKRKNCTLMINIKAITTEENDLYLYLPAIHYRKLPSSSNKNASSTLHSSLSDKKQIKTTACTELFPKSVREPNCAKWLQPTIYFGPLFNVTRKALKNCKDVGRAETNQKRNNFLDSMKRRPWCAL